MKMSSISDKTQFLTRTVQDKKDTSQFSRQFSEEKEKQNKEKAEEVEVSEENVTQAIQQYSEESAVQNNGIHISMEGNGPGLRVILKDGSGAVIRQLSGEDFLKLKQMTDKDARKQNKLLNIKV